MSREIWLVVIAMMSSLSCTLANAAGTVPKSERIGNVTAERLLRADSEPGAWLTGGRDYQQSYYSPLDGINRSNVRQLGFAWEYDIDATDGFEATPIVVDGIMFGSGPKGAVYALDARTGAERWTFKPQIDTGVMSKICCGPVNRGVAVWRGRVYVGSLDGYLYALDAATGGIAWKVDTITDRSRGYSSTGAPYIAKDCIVIGNSGAEFDARGYVTAYDSQTGKQRWRFFTVPGNPKRGFEHPELAKAAKTWDANSLWHVGLGGTVWDGMAYDPKLNLLYIGTGNGDAQPRKLRSPAGGDNLFVSSIIAINADTGRMAWYYQTTPSDNWDYDAAQKMVLAELTIVGKARKVLMQANKNGFFYVLDRVTGELISAEPFVKVNWASGVDRKTGRPVETGQGEYFREAKLVFPSWFGGHNWQPMSFNPGTGLVYIPAMEAPVIFSVPKQPFTYQRGGENSASVGVFAVPGPYGWGSQYSAEAKELPALETLTRGQGDPRPRGFLRAWDPIKQRIAWEVDTSGPWAGDPSAMWNGGGVISTAGGVVFQGRGTGELVALDVETGKSLHHIEVGTGLMAAPMTYTVDEEQYVAVMAGTGGSLGGLRPPGSAAYRYGNRGRVLAFKLGGGAVPLPPELAHDQSEFPQPPIIRRGTPASIEQGARLFERNCSKCHSNTGEGRVPDLRKMSASTHAEFDDVLLNGTRAERGMGNFSGLLSVEGVQAIHDYLIDWAWKNYEETHPASIPHRSSPAGPATVPNIPK